LPGYAFSLDGDTITMIDIASGVKQWQEWWKDYNKKTEK
jgi:hypothetical protein